MREVVMETGFVILRDGEIVGKEKDVGNASELHMVMCEMHPNSKVEIREFVGCIISSA